MTGDRRGPLHITGSLNSRHYRINYLLLACDYRSLLIPDRSVPLHTMSADLSQVVGFSPPDRPVCPPVRSMSHLEIKYLFSRFLGPPATYYYMPPVSAQRKMNLTWSMVCTTDSSVYNHLSFKNSVRAIWS